MGTPFLTVFFRDYPNVQAYRVDIFSDYPNVQAYRVDILGFRII
jgi:hypothetical protein